MSFEYLGEDTTETVEDLEGPSREEYGQQIRDGISKELVKVGAKALPLPGQPQTVVEDNFAVGVIALLIIVFLLLS